ncbi:MAG: alpha/beta fold hydrolase [Xanthomonadales bacterium]|nr:alpha/beta fold hydrolase [Xanthomonadales bacterium]
MSPAALRPLGSTLGRLFPEFTAGLVASYATRPRPLPPRPQPEDAEPVTLRFGLAGLRWGNSGPRVVALHGWQGSAAQFAPIARVLVARGLQVLALDAPAHGRTPGEFASPTVFSDALLESAPELGSVEAVIGHSMGGGAVLYALSQGLRAKRAIVVSAPAHFAEVLQRTSRQLALPQRAEAAFVARMERLTGVPAAALDISALARRFTGELLVVHDRSDRIIPYGDGARIASTARVPLLSTDGLGHARLLTDRHVADSVAAFAQRGRASLNAAEQARLN